jgi:hypothetical protein
MIAAVRIIKAPIGEAPLWVREAWIGCELPLRDPRERTIDTVGVLSIPRSFFGRIAALWTQRTVKETGYLVDAALAVDRLSAARPDAADWWRANCRWVGKERRAFLFDTPACEPIYSATANDV